MAFLDKLSDIGQSVAQKSGEIYESSKITVNIKKKEKDIRTVKKNIGEIIYNMYKEGSEFNDDIMELCAKIDDITVEIENLEIDKESIGIKDYDIEVVDAEDVTDEDFLEIGEDSEDLEDILNEL